MKVLSYDYIHKHKTANGAWTKKQLDIIGVAWPPKHGWMDRVCGTILTDEEAVAFEQAKYEFKEKHSRTKDRNPRLLATLPSVTGPSVFKPLCHCSVPPWEDCEHTDALAQAAMNEILSGTVT